MHRKIRAIIVDDEPRLRRGIERLVLSDPVHWEVQGSYSNAIECLEEVKDKNRSFDLLITDVKMPGMDGLTLIKKLKEFQTFESIVISGFDDFQFLQTAIREGASDYFIKPINREEFKSQMEKMKKTIIAKWKEKYYLEDVEYKASQLSYVKQRQILSELTWKQDMDVSLFEWTKDFPQGIYRLMYISMDNMISKSKSFREKERNVWAFAIENICEEMQKNLKNSFIQSWRWQGENLSFWLLLSTQDRIRGDLFLDTVNNLL